jgi:hypothetical protein
MTVGRAGSNNETSMNVDAKIYNSGAEPWSAQLIERTQSGLL